jgi:hypothetical protein
MQEVMRARRRATYNPYYPVKLIKAVSDAELPFWLLPTISGGDRVGSSIST